MRRRSIFIAFIKGYRPVFLPPRLPLPQPSQPQAPAPRIRFLPLLPGPLVMSGSISQGRWAASSVTEEDIAKLQKARYLTAEIPHRLCTKGQVIPTPKSGERVTHPSLPPRARVSPSPLCSRPHVLLWARFSRSSSGLFSPHLGVHRCVRGLSPHSPTLRPMA